MFANINGFIFGLGRKFKVGFHTEFNLGQIIICFCESLFFNKKKNEAF